MIIEIFLGNTQCGYSMNNLSIFSIPFFRLVIRYVFLYLHCFRLVGYGGRMHGNCAVDVWYLAVLKLVGCLCSYIFSIILRLCATWAEPN